jgi:hypothetical protein
MTELQWRMLTIPAIALETRELLSDWRWLVPQVLSPMWVNAFGDWIFADANGGVHFLDLLEGTLTHVAKSNQAFIEMLETRDNQEHFLMREWVEICRERGLLLSDGQCYGWKVAPLLGGKLEFENIQIFDLLVYESIMGQIHRQLKKLPKDYVITEFKVGANPR